MNKTFFGNVVLSRTWAVVTSIALILSAFPASFLYAASANVAFISPQKTNYEVNEEIVFTALRGDTLPQAGTITVVLTSANGAQFSGANANTGSCTGTFAAGPANANITGNNSQKGFCYKNTNTGSDTITATFTQGTSTEQFTIDLNIVEAKVINEPEKKVDICHATDSVSNPFVKNNVDVSGLNGHGGHPDDIIPVTDTHPGQNLSTMYGGKTGAEVLAADCEVPQIIENPPTSAVLAEICKKDEQGNPISGWEMTLTNDDDLVVGETGEDGCFYVSDIDVEDGTWYAMEDSREGYEQVSVTASEPYGSVVLEPQAEDEKEMCQFVIDRGPLAGSIHFYTPITIEPVFRCDFVNKKIPDVPPTPCVDGQKDWADKVHSASQAKLKNGNPITDPNRTDSSKVLGVSDWTSGASTGFYSLGFGGSVAVEFDNYVLDVEGVDISIHEATNGKYPLERAEIFVSQNGSDWTSVGYADNTAGDKVTYLDISGSGLAWIKFVKVVDVSDPSLHSATADAFDLDAVDATKSVCDKPEDPEPEYADFCGDGVVNQEWEQCDPGHLQEGSEERFVGCSEQCQYIGEPICTDLTLARIDMSVQNKGAGDMTTDVYLGQGTLPIPSGAWFLVYSNGSYVNDADISGYEDVPGLAVERSGGSVRSVMHGSTSAKDKEHVHGTIGFWSWDGSVEATSVTSDNSGNNKLEGNYSDGSGIGKMNAGDDEVSILNGVAKFWLTTTTADDGFITEYSKPVVCEEDPVCEVDVNLIENGGFELPTVSSWKVFYTGAPGLAWLTGERGIEIQRGVAGSPYSGRQHAELDPHHPTMIWQEIATIPGETYKFSTYYSPRPGRDAEDNRFEFLLNGAALGSSIARSGVGNPNTVWTLEEREFVATGTTTSVGFREIGTDTSYGAYIDDVSLSCIRKEPPVDVCSNIDGNQSEVPEGYEVVDGDICRPVEPPPIDACSNLPGDQDEVPAGYELVDEDYCQMIVVLGCTDPEATNYNPLATAQNADAEKCDYPESSTPTTRKRSGGSYIGTFLRAQPAPLVLGASTTSLCPLIVDHMQMGWNNRSSEVIKLQLFLNIFKDMYGGVENPVTGFFGPITDANVKAFQEKYRSEVLDPWFTQGIVPHNRPTGFVYKTTKWKINSIVCPDSVTPVNFEGENLLTNVDIIRN